MMERADWLTGWLTDWQVLALKPKIFRYNGLGGTDTSGQLYVGVLAQEVGEHAAERDVPLDALARRIDS